MVDSELRQRIKDATAYTKETVEFLEEQRIKRDRVWSELQVKSDRLLLTAQVVLGIIVCLCLLTAAMVIIHKFPLL